MCRTKRWAPGAVLVAMIFVTAGPLAQARKPAPPPPPLPPIRYEVQYFEVSAGDVVSVRAMNNTGQVVGRFTDSTTGQGRAFLYDPSDPVMNPPGSAVGIACDLKNLDFEDGYGVPTGWVIRTPADINDSGDIVGNLEEVASGNWRGFVLNRCRATEAGEPLPPRLYTVPGEDQLGSTSCYTYRINESGDVLGCYHIGDPLYGWYIYNPGINPESAPYPLTDLELPVWTNEGQLSNVLYGNNGECLGPMFTTFDEQGVLRRFPWTDDGTPERLDTWKLQRVDYCSGSGSISGKGWFEVPINKNRTKEEFLPYLLKLDGTLEIVGDSGQSPSGINSNDDVLLNDYSLYHSELHAVFGNLKLDDLVVGDDSASWLESSKSLADINDRLPVTDSEQIAPMHFGQIAGAITFVNSGLKCGFVLTPVAYP